MTNEISLRDAQQSDLPVFFEHQLDPEATRMAAFPARPREEFMAHWAKIMAEETTFLKTILFHGNVAGNIVSWNQSGMVNVGFWLGKEYWGKRIASTALAEFLGHVRARPLYAHVAKHNIASLRVLEKCGFTITGEGKFAVAGGEEGEEFILSLAANVSDHARLPQDLP
jgi:RimJ/RimL family protein N-acetyltransferase